MSIHLNKVTHLIVISVLLVTACGAPSEPAPMDSGNVPGSSRLSELLRDDSTDQFPKATEIREFTFPADHAAHEAYRNEWWYFTGNLDDDSGRRFGYELTLFRFSLRPEDGAPLDSSWQTRQVYIGHLALTDVDNDAFHVAQRYSRGAAGLAGATTGPVAIWLDDWRIEQDDGDWLLTATDSEFGISLALSAIKPIVLNGDRGLSRKSREPGNASYYYSVPRLDTRGEIRADDQVFEVTGLSWLDREWGSSALARDQRGWDWFALQMSDGSDLMVYQIRRNDGSPDDYSSGTHIRADGRATTLKKADFDIEVLDTWDSERGGTYPAAWRVTIDSLDLSLVVEPVIADQELVTNVRYWEGAVDVNGQSGGDAISGRGYVELTGYADP